MKNLIIVAAILLSSIANAQFNISKGLKEAGKKVEKKLEEKKQEDKPVDKKQEAKTGSKNTKTSETSTVTSGEVPKTSKAYITWTNYDRNMKMARTAVEKGELSNLGQQVKYCTKFLSEMKTKDSSIDYSSFDAELAAMKAKADNFASNASSAASAEENQRESLRDEREKYHKLYETQSNIEHSSRSSSTPILISGKEYLQIASTFKKEEVTKAVDEWVASHPQDGTIKDLKKELADYENYITYSGILTYANKLAERSYELSKQKNTPKAIEAAENAKGYCNGVLLLSPNNQAAKTALAFAEKAYNNASASIGQSLTGNFHKSNVNKIVFSKKPLTIGTESASDVATTFSSTDEIYGTVYFSDKMINILREGGTKFFTTITVNGEKHLFYDAHITISPDEKQNSYLQFALVPPDNYDYSKDIKASNTTILDFNKYMTTKAPVSFNIKIAGEIAKTGEKLQGEFTYDISGGVTKNEKIQQKMEDLFAESVRLPKPAQSNPDLLAKMTQGMNEKGKGVKYSNGRITSGDWKINKNDLGIIIDRTMTAYFVATHPDGHCEMVGNIFVQEYAGNGTYGGLRVLIDPFERKRMNCANANK